MLSCCVAQGCACCASQTIRLFGHAVPVNYPRVMNVLIFGSVALVSWLCGMYIPDYVLNYAGIFSECSVPGRGEYDIRSCYVSLFVVRAMAALAVWYGILALLTLHINDPSDWRVNIYAGCWGPKVLVLLIMIVVSFFMPNGVFAVYSWIALVGAAVFIIVQIIVLIDFACEWASSWVSKMEDDADEYGIDGCGAAGCNNGYFVALMSTSSAMFLGGFVIVILLYVFFTQEYVKDGCSAGGLNAFFITTQLIMSIVCAVCSILPAVKDRTPDSGLLQSSFVAIYTAYLVTSALLSEPKSWKEGCNSFYTDAVVFESSGSTVVPWYHGISSMEHFTAFIGAVITIVAVCYSTFRTSGSTEKLMISEDKTADKASVISKVADDDGDTAVTVSSSSDDGEGGHPMSLPFSFSLFHVAFMVGSMYVQQLLTNWETISSSSDSTSSLTEITVDSGVGSVWAKIISSWLVFLLYLWSLFAPLIFPDRDFGYGVSYSF